MKNLIDQKSAAKALDEMKKEMKRLLRETKADSPSKRS